ncbi:MAG: hypothetical protein JXO51_00745 [Candidatus Aminicenantes bacterium]|nr:hypothetical protein [Candidatus Aminicenantes bacterium]
MAPARAWVVSVLMGLGHLRAAYPLRGIANEGIILYGSRRTTPPREYRIWRRLRKIYYFSSNVGRVPVLGRPLLNLLLALQRIQPYYPRRDLSRPNLAVRYLDRQISRKGLCRGLLERLGALPLPRLHSFYATAMASDRYGAAGENYLLICDSDFNRVWVPRDPRSGRLKYLAPCTQVRNRLLAYGIAAERIFLTGFPLPKENIGSREGLEILRADLFQRLLRLDPKRKFFSYHRRSVLGWLGQDAVPEAAPGPLRLTFAIGGAGAQCEMARVILQSLKPAIAARRIRVTISAGINQRVYERLLGYVNRMQLGGELAAGGLELVYDPDVYGYLDKFNRILRTTDVLWTKPSELSFYCALGIPILMAPPIGTHEELNRCWLREIHAGVEPAGPLRYTHEWLFDLLENGRLAEAAWDGFLKARKLGTFQIEELIQTGSCAEGQTPLEQ